MASSHKQKLPRPEHSMMRCLPYHIVSLYTMMLYAIRACKRHNEGSELLSVRIQKPKAEDATDTCEDSRSGQQCSRQM